MEPVTAIGRRAGLALLLLIVLGTLPRLAFVDRPMDERTLSPWREADYAQLARSFDREGMNPLYPRIDWRGDTAGYVEMEFPALPWSAALLYRLFGYHEELLRLLSALASVAALVAFALLARRVLPPAGALFATAAFAANGLLLALAGSMQPEPLALLLTLLAAGAIYSWWESGSSAALYFACACTAAAILAKSPAAHLGLLLAWLVLRRGGRRALVDPRIYAAAALALVPPLVWYAWAYHHYLATGLSLGVSNETHWLSWEVLRDPVILRGILKAELQDVFGLFGVALAACALLERWAKIEVAAVWYAAMLVLYTLTADTSGDAWAFYYHSSSIPSACLLMGFGFAALLERGRPPRTAAALLAALTLLSLAGRGVELIRRRADQPQLAELRHCCLELAPHVPAEGHIVVRGGRRTDRHGHPVAYNESMAFTWMDRQGFNYAVEDFHLEHLEAIARRGGRYWLAHPVDLADEDLRRQIERRFRRIQSCDGYVLYDLSPGEP